MRGLGSLRDSQGVIRGLLFYVMKVYEVPMGSYEVVYMSGTYYYKQYLARKIL